MPVFFTSATLTVQKLPLLKTLGTTLPLKKNRQHFQDVAVVAGIPCQFVRLARP